MKHTLTSLVLLFVILPFYSTRRESIDNNGVNVMAYYVAPRNNYKPQDLPLDKLTHIIFSFTEVIDNEMKFKRDSSGIKLKMLVAQKKKHRHLKVMVACGGWGGSGGFSEMARIPENRKIFVKSVIRFIKEYKLDGLDIDWEYPGMEGIGNPYIPEDKENFTSLMRELREAMDATGKKLVLTFAAAGWEPYFDHIELTDVMKYVNYMNIMSYDMATGGTPYTAHHTNLGWVKNEDILGTPAAKMMQEKGDTLGPRSAEKIITFCIDRGAKPEQLVIGAAFYGRAWKGVSPDNHGLYQLNKGPWNQSTRYSAIRAKYEDKNGFVRYWDPVAKAPYLYNPVDSIFISYDDTVSIKLKTEYASKMGMAGIMFWQLGSDTLNAGLVDAIYAEKMRLK